jgi:hypothetical protein
MDFIYGILFLIIIIFILINFASVSISNKQTINKQNSNNVSNVLNPYGQGQNMQNINNSTNPAPINANSPLALNKKINLEEQTYDYNKYFFV